MEWGTPIGATQLQLLEARKVIVHDDSQLIMNQLNDAFELKD